MSTADHIAQPPHLATGDLVRIEWGGQVIHAIATDVEMDDEGGTFRLIVDPDDEDSEILSG